MKSTRIFFVVAVAALLAACGDQTQDQAQDQTDGAPAAAARTVAFVGVNVVPMEREEVLADRTVIVTDGRIAAIGGVAAVAVPEGAEIIEGAGRYLMPGLSDMHVHIGFSVFAGGLPGVAMEPQIKAMEDELLLYLANGITTVRNMWGHPAHLALRARIAAGEVPGPTIYTAGPILDGDPPVWPTSVAVGDGTKARQAVLEQVDAGYDFIKVYSLLGREAYDAIIATAAEKNIPVIGHVSSKVGLDHALASGQKSIEHFSDYERTLADSDIIRSNVPTYFLWADAKPERMAQAAAASVAAGVWNCPTLVVVQNALPDDEIPALFERPEMSYVSPYLEASWRKSPILALFDEPARAAMVAAHPKRLALLRALHEAGDKLLVGTDSSALFVIPGFSIHRELGYFVDAGLSPYDTLRIATRDAAEFLGRLEDAGTVEVGKRADLLLLEANPLADVANVANRAGVMMGGRWLGEDDLQGRLADLAARYVEEGAGG